MIKEKISKYSSAALLVAMSLSALPVSAQLGARLNVDAGADATVGSTTGVKAAVSAKMDAKMEKRVTTAKTHADQEITRRVDGLNSLKGRIQLMSHLSDAGRSGVSAMFQAQIDALTNLKGKIDGESDIDLLKTDIKTITQSYRIYALVIPQGAILVASDRMATVSDALNELGTKLAARLATASQGGANVTEAATVLNDMGTKISDAKVKIQAAVTATTNLKPDDGNEATFQANKDALKDARKTLQDARASLDAARKDARTIIKDLKSFKIDASASAQASSTTSTTDDNDNN